MPSTPPFVAQERPDSCAVACLRMLLAHHNTHISEAELIRKTTLDEGGLTPAELAALARECGFAAKERCIDDSDLAQMVKEGKFAIVYVYRKVLDGVDTVHAVIPVRFSRRFVTLLDPLRGRRRVSITKFVKSRAMVQRWAVVLE
jgi:ABC-type bacteriocin/lantibiotic exporter with double-glycine peptidase domain